jgi:hypothetical protein
MKQRIVTRRNHAKTDAILEGRYKGESEFKGKERGFIYIFYDIMKFILNFYCNVSR